MDANTKVKPHAQIHIFPAGRLLVRGCEGVSRKSHDIPFLEHVQPPHHRDNEHEHWQRLGLFAIREITLRPGSALDARQQSRVANKMPRVRAANEGMDVLFYEWHDVEGFSNSFPLK